MKTHRIFLISILSVLILIGALVVFQNINLNNQNSFSNNSLDVLIPNNSINISGGTTSPKQLTLAMKLVNEDVTDADLQQISNLGVTIVEGEWGISEASSEEVTALLDKLQAKNLKLLMNFSDGASWGYKEDGTDNSNLPPTWQAQKVKSFIEKIKNHPALFGYDIANESGENFPNSDQFRLTINDLKKAAETVRNIDPTKPIVIRLRYDDIPIFFKTNAFADNIADIVMINIYSNYTEDGTTRAMPKMMEDAQAIVDSIKNIDSDIKIWIAVGTFKEQPLFIKPKSEWLSEDINIVKKIPDVTGLVFFGWGPERYPTQGQGWYLPRDGADLLTTIKESNK